MKLGQVVEWEQDVFPSWRSAACNSSHTNSDIWSRLPQGVCWVSGQIELQDLAQLFVVGSQDWHEVFGSYQLQTVAEKYTADLHDQKASLGKDDEYRHHTRIGRLIESLQHDASHISPLILAAANVQGPMVLLDGNHRALALWQLKKLAGQSCFLGLHSKMASDFLWMRRALA